MQIKESDPFKKIESLQKTKNLIAYKNSIAKRELEKHQQLIGALASEKPLSYLFDNEEELLNSKRERPATFLINDETNTKVLKSRQKVDKLSKISDALTWKQNELVQF